MEANLIQIGVVLILPIIVITVTIKEESPLLRPYGNKYEVDISSLKRIEKTLL